MFLFPYCCPSMRGILWSLVNKLPWVKYQYRPWSCQVCLSMWQISMDNSFDNIIAWLVYLNNSWEGFMTSSWIYHPFKYQLPMPCGTEFIKVTQYIILTIHNLVVHIFAHSLSYMISSNTISTDSVLHPTFKMKHMLMPLLQGEKYKSHIFDEIDINVVVPVL